MKFAKGKVHGIRDTEGNKLSRPWGLFLNQTLLFLMLFLFSFPVFGQEDSLSYMKGKLRPKVEQQRERMSGISIELVSGSGEVVKVYKTDEDGEFKVRGGEASRANRIRIRNDEELELQLSNDQGKEVVLVKDEAGNFLYQKVGTKEEGVLDLLKEEGKILSSGSRKLTGQFVHKGEPSRKTGPLKVAVVDAEEKVLLRQTTDKFGNFLFQELPSIKGMNLVLRNKQENQGLTLLIYDDEGRVVSELKSGNQGVFQFRKVPGESGPRRILSKSEDSLEAGSYLQIFGKLTLEGKGNKIPKGITIKVREEEGEKVLFSKNVDEKGFFRFSELPLTGKAYIDISGMESLDGEVYIKVLDRQRNVMAVLESNSDGFFVYRELKGDKATLSLTPEEEFAFEPTGKLSRKQNFSIQFPSNSHKLTDSAQKQMEAIHSLMVDQPDLQLQVKAYASVAGDKIHNEELSEKRAKAVADFFREKGIKMDRISAKGMGEMEGEKLAENRRVDLILY